MHINEAMKRLGQGKVAEEFEDALRTACQKAVGLDGKSEVSLKLAIVSNGDGVEIQSTVALKTPTVRHAKTFMFLDEEGELTAQDPRQGILQEVTANV